jgi:NADH-quinone oxidoreductase subunit C
MRPEHVLAERFPSAGMSVEHDLLTADVPTGSWVAALTFARDELDCGFFDWLSAVDEQADGIQVVAHVYSVGGRHHLLLRTTLSGENPSLPTASGVYPGANWHERETHEMFGVDFPGHPGLRPLLLPDGFAGHPLRKDFVLASRVIKQWPGAVEAGQAAAEAKGNRRVKPLGVPAPGEWGPA